MKQRVFHGSCHKGFEGGSNDKQRNTLIYRVLKGPGVSKRRGCAWGTLRIRED